MNKNWLIWVKETFFQEPAERALNLGCGDGCLERHGAVIDVFRQCDAFDLSPTAIEIATNKAEQLGIRQRVNYTVADIDNIHLTKDYYDVAFCAMSMHHFENLEHILREINNSLKQNSLLIVNEYIGPKRFQWTDKQLSIANEMLGLLPEKYRLDPATETMKKSIQRQTVEQMIAVDPSEAVRSSDIIPLILEQFEFVKRIDYGGTILNLLLENIILNFDETKSEDMAILNSIFYVERLLINEGILDSDFSMLVARKK
jgi:ubiquinone/menaquinone biosynthesis C-methylase UbiE